MKVCTLCGIKNLASAVVCRSCSSGLIDETEPQPDFRARGRRIEGMKTCASCGETWHSDTIWCPKCCTARIVAKHPQAMNCPHDEAYYGADSAKPNSEFTAKIVAQPDFRARTCGECAWARTWFGAKELKDRKGTYSKGVFFKCRKYNWQKDDKDTDGDITACPAFVEAKP